MGGSFRRLLAVGRTFSLRRFRPVGARLEVVALEDRGLLTPTAIMAHATPKVLSPPNGEYLPVTVSGSLRDSTPNETKGSQTSGGAVIHEQSALRSARFNSTTGMPLSAGDKLGPGLMARLWRYNRANNSKSAAGDPTG